MVNRLRHRGPDAFGIETLPGCILGHARLSIIDLVSGGQPMSSADNRYWITFNGEIFNYRELRVQLEKRNVVLRTQSDTEVILGLYAEYGADSLRYLNGQFAFAIWDTQTQTLFCARDRLGEKPFYYATGQQGEFLFASEIKALIASELLRPKIDPVAVDAYLSLLYVPPDRSIYANVHVLPPGHMLVYHEGSVTVRRYWNPVYDQNTTLDINEAVEQVRLLVKQAVERQMIADVTVGAFLSGGLDSSTIVALMTQHTSRPVQTFSAGFGTLIDELPYARSVAAAYQTDHHEIQIDVPVRAMIERMAQVYDEPFADSSNIPTYLISEFASRYVKVALSGDGGDELFGGYDWYSWLLQDRDLTINEASFAVAQASAFAWRALAKTGAPVMEQRNSAVHHRNRIRYTRSFPNIWDRHFAAMHYFRRSERAALWGAANYADADPVLRAIYREQDQPDNLDSATDFDIRCYLPGDILVKVDRAALAHGLESRAPFLDVDLVEFVLGLPWQLRFKDNEQKHLLRAAFSNIWPPVIRKRKKQGFGAPLDGWMKDREVQELVWRTSNPGSPLQELLPGIAKQSRLTGYQRWILMCLGLWLEMHSDAL